MTSFYYWDQNSFRFYFIFKYGKPSEVQITKALLRKKSKTIKDSGSSSEMMPFCKWPIETWGYLQTSQTINKMSLLHFVMNDVDTRPYQRVKLNVTGFRDWSVSSDTVYWKKNAVERLGSSRWKITGLFRQTVQCCLECTVPMTSTVVVHKALMQEGVFPD